MGQSKEYIQINLSRLTSLLEYFDYSKEQFLNILNQDRKRLYSTTDIWQDSIALSLLKQIDKIFKKGLSFYTDPTNLDCQNTVLFRKPHKNAKLSHQDRLLVAKIEDRICHLEAIANLSGYQVQRKLAINSLQQNPTEIGFKLHEQIIQNLPIETEDRNFLAALIERFSESGIIVFEHIESPAKKLKVNLDGFFIAPQYIALKRLQQSLKREIFTLAHEFGHYLLNTEGLDQISDKITTDNVECWCNRFAYAFLLGEEKYNIIENLEHHNLDTAEIQKITEQCHISRDAVFYHLAENKKISLDDYTQICDELRQEFETQELQRKKEQQLDRQKKIVKGIKPIIPPAKPIYSELEKDIYREAYHEGVLGEADILQHFEPKKSEINRFFLRTLFMDNNKKYLNV